MTGSLFSEHSSEQFRKKKNAVLTSRPAGFQIFLCKCREGNGAQKGPDKHNPPPHLKESARSLCI